MKRVSLENMMKEVFNNGKVIKTETKDTVYGNECMTTIQYGTFKCKLPVSGIAATLKYAKSMSRKPTEKFPVPASQNILAFLYKFKKVIPYYIEWYIQEKAGNGLKTECTSISLKKQKKL